MTSEVYPCTRCKDQREYIYDSNGVICSYTPCKCDTNQRPILLNSRGIKTLDLALNKLEQYNKELLK